MAKLIEVRVTGLPNMPDLAVRPNDQGEFQVHDDTDGVAWTPTFTSIHNALVRIAARCRTVNEFGG